ncbi:MAG TPA: M28 family peptidase, partial [Ignavibacteriaceae bacterium]
IALYKDFKSMVGIGSEHSTLNNFLIETLNKFDLSIAQIPEEFYQFDAFSRSDQLMFASAGIPSILVLEGPDNKHLTRDEVISGMIDYNIYHYHKPSDDLNNIVIDYEAAQQHAEVLKDLIISISNSENKPEWNEGSPYINERLRSVAEKR